jgi:hypothetical protein
LSSLFKKVKKAFGGVKKAKEPESRFGKSRPLTDEEVAGIGGGIPGTIQDGRRRRRYGRGADTVLSAAPGSDRLGP